MNVIALDPGFGNTNVCFDGKVRSVQSAIARPQDLGLVAIGMRQARHVDQNLGALGWELSPEELAQIDAVVEDADLGIRILDPDEYLEQVK